MPVIWNTEKDVTVSKHGFFLWCYSVNNSGVYIVAISSHHFTTPCARATSPQSRRRLPALAAALAIRSIGTTARWQCTIEEPHKLNQGVPNCSRNPTHRDRPCVSTLLALAIRSFRHYHVTHVVSNSKKMIFPAFLYNLICQCFRSGDTHEMYKLISQATRRVD